MKIKTVASITALVLFSSLSTGCFKSSKQAYKVPESSSFLGLVEYESGTFSPTTKNTFAVSSEELVPRDNFSGDRVKLFWGLITLED
ncbi:MAG: hypothetical protein ACPGN3_09275 [Opitutales bacterium]